MLGRRCAACIWQARQYSSLASASYANATASKPFSTTSSSASSSSSSDGQASTPPSSPSPSPSSTPSTKPPPLPRPLGLSEPPRRHQKLSLRERAERMADKDARIQERRHLVKEAATGYFEDYNKLRHHGGKMWVAPRTLIQEKAALYFPEMEGTSLSSSASGPVRTSELLAGKISIVAMLSTRMSEAHVESYISPPPGAHAGVLDSFRSDPLFQFVQINCQENKLKWLLVGIFIASLRRSVPEEYRSTYLVSTENLEYLREPMGMTNKHLGYVYLVDENCKIRWAALSTAQSEAAEEGSKVVDEVQALANCTSVLLQRLRAGSQETQ